ncbi:MAG: FAD-dependent oxidoreductase [Polaromonas sp.]
MPLPQNSSTPGSRRSFLEAIGKLGGAGAMYQTMVAMGMLQTPAAWAGPARLPAGMGTGKTVVILGAGMAGMASAYELQKAGYRCIILEALGRPGGRNFTARRGTQVVEDTGPNGRTVQTCAFDDGMYLNLGPARLPFHHPRLMHYCKEFAIALEVYVMSSTANLYQTDKAFNGQAMPRYRLGSDSNNHIAELLTKAVNQNALDAQLKPDDRQVFLDMLKVFGDLPQDGSATVGSETPRSGCVSAMTVQAICAANPRLPLNELLKSGFWQHLFYQPFEGEWQPTLFQPVGGMDKIVDAFIKRVGKTIRYHAQAIDITNKPDGVDVVYRDTRSGKTTLVRADHCLCNMPLPKLAQIKTNLSDDFKQAIAHARIGALYKLGWQANRRFWEEAPYNIYGGISYTDNPITQMWYPSNDYQSRRGVLAGSYSYFEQAEAFGRMSLAERIRAARQDAAKLHKEFSSEALLPSSKAVSIAWNQAEGQSGGVALWNPANAADNRAYQRLLAPDGRFFVIGDQVSPLPGWQEGAFLSSEHAVQQITGKRPTLLSEMHRSPEAQRMMNSVA